MGTMRIQLHLILFWYMELRMKICRRFETVVAFHTLICIGVLNQLAQVDAFQCYKCSTNEMPRCLDDPAELRSSVECEGFCTILRTEYTEIPGEMITLIRDCEDEPLVPNGVRTEKHYTKMYTSCETELCNEGDGRREPGDEDNPDRLGPSSIIRVAETGSAVAIKPLWLFIGIVLLLNFSVLQLRF